MEMRKERRGRRKWSSAASASFSSSPIALLLLLLSLFFLAFFVTPIQGGINDYDSTSFPSETYEQTHVALYTPADSPSHSPPGNGTSFIDVDLELQKPKKDAILSMAFVGAEDRTMALGKVIGNRRKLCCDDDVAKEAGCTPGQLLLNDTVHLYSGILNSSSPSIHATWTPWKSQVYYFYIINCGPSDVVIDGKVTWMNPYGYLPGEDYPVPYFYIALAVGYAFSLLLWLISSFIYRADLQRLQNVIAGVFALGFIGAIPGFLQYDYYNQVGHPSFFWVLSSVILNVGKRLISRVLIVLVSSGWSVVRPNLEGKTLKLGLPLLSLVYLLCAVTFDIVQSLRNKLNTYVTTSWDLLILPITLLDIVFYCWIMFSLLATMHWLHQRKQEEKLRMYRLFWWTLLVLGGLSVVVTFVQSVFMWQGKRDLWWQSWWLFEAWWQTLYLAILWVVAFIWRPNSNNKRYAYSLQIAGNEEEGTQLDEISTGVVSVRGEDANYDPYTQEETYDENAIVMDSSTIGASSPPAQTTDSSVDASTTEESITIPPPPPSSSSSASTAKPEDKKRLDEAETSNASQEETP